MNGVRVLLLAVLAGLAAPAGASALTLTPCKDQKGFGCGVVRVPLDRTGAVPGRIGLRVAVQDTAAARAKPGLLIALTGGPGQGGVFAASGFAGTLKPLLRTRRLVTLDQRGTGDSDPLSCPAVQALSSLDAYTPATVAGCADRIGAARRSFTTQDTVADLDAVREALGAPKVALMGVSYGTYVAQRYARVHPDRTERLVLDSIVSPGGVEPFLLDTYSRMGRVLREQCARSRCKGVTTDPVADLAALVPRLAAGSVSGRVYDTRGRPGTATFRTGEELFDALIAGDLNPYLQAALPGALAAARAGDEAPLARLRHVAAGGPTPTADLSGALNVVTSCQDVRLPYALTTPVADRRTQGEAALAALPPAAYAPWDPETVFDASYVDDCLQFPDAGAAPSAAPLPAVPTLVLSGRLDLRTPLENGVALKAELPTATRVLVGGTGHDVLDSDLTGCAARALDRWERGRDVGTPCAGKTNAVTVLPQPPRGLAAYPEAPGIAGDRGRVLLAALDTVQDARLTLLQRLFAGLDGSAGGLRGGRLSAPEDLSRITLRNYSYLRGVRVTGSFRSNRGRITGTVVVRGPAALDGTLQITPGGATGTLGGRAVRYRERSARAARISSGSSAPLLAPRAASLPDRLNRRLG